MLQSLASEQNKDVTLSNLKNQSQLPAQYKIHNNILFKLIKHDWKVVVSNEMLHKLIKPTYESLALSLIHICSKHYLCSRK